MKNGEFGLGLLGAGLCALIIFLAALSGHHDDQQPAPVPSVSAPR